ncbi:MAG: carbon monoxide dehydrogenase, partial [Firmicutes bacterium]|nr:carbon monoxide dehydrogenase [Bacillota bacterium]
VEQLSEEIARTGLELWGDIPFDSAVVEYDLAGKALLELPSESIAVKAAGKIFDSLSL